MESTRNPGQLVIIGGAEDKDRDCKVLREFVRCAGGTKAKIVVLTAATSEPREAGEDYIRVFERLGVEEVPVFDPIHREDADIMFTIVPIFMGIFFVIFVVIFLLGLRKELTKWRYNNQQPVLSITARVVAKRTYVSGFKNSSSYYYCTFEVRDSTRHEFCVEGEQYGQLVEGDTGTLTYQGTRYRGFDRQLSH